MQAQAIQNVQSRAKSNEFSYNTQVKTMNQSNGAANVKHATFHLN